MKCQQWNLLRDYKYITGRIYFLLEMNIENDKKIRLFIFYFLYNNHFLPRSSPEWTLSQLHTEFPELPLLGPKIKDGKFTDSRPESNKVHVINSVCLCSRHSALSRCSPCFSFTAASTELVFHSTQHIRAEGFLLLFFSFCYTARDTSPLWEEAKLWVVKRNLEVCTEMSSNVWLIRIHAVQLQLKLCKRRCWRWTQECSFYI